MTPLVVIARLGGAISLPRGELALDALLAAQMALRGQLPPPRDASDCVPIEIPVEREPGQRFYLCSFSVAEFDAHALRYINRRAPVEQYQTIGETKIRRVQITTGANKSYRIPMETKNAVDDALAWWCIGDAEKIRDLLTTALYLGKKRAVGLGRVLWWDIQPCEPWQGFPVVSPDGKPLRPLPTDWPGLNVPRTEFRTLSFPYWDHSREELCAVP
jgi:CRISPR type IV-associated protein Csf3